MKTLEISKKYTVKGNALSQMDVQKSDKYTKYFSIVYVFVIKACFSVYQMIQIDV
jgi:hypothetical protein